MSEAVDAKEERRPPREEKVLNEGLKDGKCDIGIA
jgi:hypothetical protein